jgi:transposase
MPWRETAPVEERDRFSDDHLLKLYTMSELCARYAVSRKTGYKWVGRYDTGGRAALVERSRAPHSSPHKISALVTDLLVRARRQHGRRFAGPPRPGKTAAPASPPSGCRAAGDARPQ